LKNHPICEVCHQQKSTQIHHKKGRVGYHTYEDYLNDFSLLENPLFFLATCGVCHGKVEQNPDWAKENEYSLSRLDCYI
jgi:hypothetical protein